MGACRSTVLANRQIRRYGDKDGDGFVKYEGLDDEGFIKQGWKDSWDGINFVDGRIAEPPIALCEERALACTAFRSRAWMAYDAGDTPLAALLTAETAQLRNGSTRPSGCRSAAASPCPGRQETAGGRVRVQHGAMPVAGHCR
jgi:hypothetical protein